MEEFQEQDLYLCEKRYLRWYDGDVAAIVKVPVVVAVVVVAISDIIAIVIILIVVAVVCHVRHDFKIRITAAGCNKLKFY